MKVCAHIQPDDKVFLFLGLIFASEDEDIKGYAFAGYSNIAFLVGYWKIKK
jgi:hypothetical protein